MDILVVGGGLAGMASAARLAKLGHQVQLLEANSELGGAINCLSQDGFNWHTGPNQTLLPAVLRDLFRKSGRELDKELQLVPAEIVADHWFPDGSTLALPGGSRAAQLAAISENLGAKAGQAWVSYVAEFADVWETLRQDYFERVYDPELASKTTKKLFKSNLMLARHVKKSLKDPRLQSLAALDAVLAGQDPKNTPAWCGLTNYLTQNFGAWRIPGGFWQLTTALKARLETRGVQISYQTTATDLLIKQQKVVGVQTSTGDITAAATVLAVDPRSFPALAKLTFATMPALPGITTHVGIAGDLPAVADRIVLHGNPVIEIKTDGIAPAGHAAWTITGRGQVTDDLLNLMAERGIDIRSQVVTRVDQSPKDLVQQWRGSPYGLLWLGPKTLTQQLPTVAKLPGLYFAGANAHPGPSVPFAGLSATLVSHAIGPAS